MIEPLDGLLAIDKPAGPTSHDIVARVRAATGVRRVGHTGTLDPPATGLLLLVLGRATRLVRFLPDAPKVYRGELVLGVTTSSDDLSGDVLHRHPGTLPASGAIHAAAAALLGRQMQVPPAVSARHIGGTRMYRLARRGVTAVAPPSEVHVARFELTPTEAEDRWGYEIEVSTGTYVRAMVRDLGKSLGCGAAVASLRRMAIGPLRVEDALALPSSAEGLRAVVGAAMIPLDAMPLTLPEVGLPAIDTAAAFAAGRAIPLPDQVAGDARLVQARGGQGTLLGVGFLSDGVLRPRVVVPAAGDSGPDSGL